MQYFIDTHNPETTDVINFRYSYNMVSVFDDQLLVDYITRCKKIRKFCMTHHLSDNWSSIMKAILKHPLEYLDVSRNGFKRKENALMFTSTSPFTYLRCIQTLNLSNSTFSVLTNTHRDKAFYAFDVSKFLRETKTLKHLILHDCVFHVISLEEIMGNGIAKNQSLETLEISAQHLIQKSFVSYVNCIAGNQTIKQLNLSDDDGIGTLIKAKRDIIRGQLFDKIMLLIYARAIPMEMIINVYSYYDMPARIALTNH